ncbi:DUF2922 domain-containing protein [Sporolactobacillus sp. THM19-2]|jgi:hypothetical protein|uniref:DUF2922 domain-containing protein n=1 Tax=Sporolactobacillus sp. THM19-2 TaxID=2511171 RepID=UPI00101EEEF5|nr:DUF2922 domain-containing protein [Sporolactobacillus sp. THM19-2]RYL89283.1 DUF2922 domain-containing protein [Sporolactobacillus sp. THM19-2]
MKRLNLVFLNTAGKSVTLSLNDPVEPADPVAVRSAMDEIIAQNVFESTGGELTQVKSARISENNTTPIEIA